MIHFHRENGEKLFGMTGPGSLGGALSPAGSHHGSHPGSLHTSPQTSPNNTMTGSRYETYLKIRSNRHARLNGQYSNIFNSIHTGNYLPAFNPSNPSIHPHKKVGFWVFSY